MNNDKNIEIVNKEMKDFHNIIFIISNNNKTIGIKIKDSDTVSETKKYLQKIDGFENIVQMKLYCHGRLLNDDNTWYDAGVNYGQYFRLVKKKTCLNTL